MSDIFYTFKAQGTFRSARFAVPDIRYCNLYISQSSISRQISSLENEWDLILFERNTKTVKLTGQGKMLSETLRELCADWNNALACAKRSAPEECSGFRSRHMEEKRLA